MSTPNVPPQDELSQDHYLGLLGLAYEVAQSLEGRTPPFPWMADCQPLAAKLFFHAATVYHLWENGTKCPVPAKDGEGSWFFDFASVQVIARSALETYLTLFQVFFEPVTDDERSFRHALWLLGGLVVREGRLPANVPQEHVFRAQQEIEDVRDRIKGTQRFASLTPRQQRQVLAGRKLNRARAELAQAAGFSEDLLDIVYSYQSGYVHADGLSGIQIIGARTREEQTQFIEASMRTTIMPCLSKMILDYEAIFPEAKAVCDVNADMLHWAKVYSGSARLVRVDRVQFFE